MFLLRPPHGWCEDNLAPASAFQVPDSPMNPIPRRWALIRQNGPNKPWIYMEFIWTIYMEYLEFIWNYSHSTWNHDLYGISLLNHGFL